MELVARPANPQQSTETIDYKIASKYVENEHKDTKAADVEKVTFVPKLATFEMDVMQQMGIQVCSLTHNRTSSPRLSDRVASYTSYCSGLGQN